MVEALELLAPARTADIGIEAIRHGADAVYIGASRFGARSAAGNSTDDIRRLVEFARPFGVRVYATINTLLYKEELPEAEALLWELGEAGVSAFIVQDPAVASLVRKLWPHGDGPRLHASTQMDNRTADHVAELTQQGYEQVVLARELTLTDIAHIHRRCPEARLEVFVHGALCVSLSGRCYASEVLCQRSANRGECAQICRLPFDLEKADGTKLLRQQHLLSLKDLCQLDALGDLIAAGARAFKIEGRLKDMAYVKNVTAAYSQALDRLVAQSHGRFKRASRGEVTLGFTPDVHKSFNRGFTHYFLYGRPTEPIHSPRTPKSLGEPIGRVAKVLTDSLLTDGSTALSNGDGLCFFSAKELFVGFRVNRVEGNRLFWHGQPPCPLTDMKPGTPLWRNYDKAFHDRLDKQPPAASPRSGGGSSSANRTIPLDFTLTQRGDRFELIATDGERLVSVCHDYPAQPARTPQADNLRRQLSRLGDTPFRLRHLDIDTEGEVFVPSSVLAQWRREVVRQMVAASPPSPLSQGEGVTNGIASGERAASSLATPSPKEEMSAGEKFGGSSLFTPLATPSPKEEMSAGEKFGGSSLFTPLASPSSKEGVSAGEKFGGSSLFTPLATPSPKEEMSAGEKFGGSSLFTPLVTPSPWERGLGGEAPLMLCRHCLRHALGWCPRQGNPTDPPPAELFLRMSDNRRLRLSFDCQQCLMLVDKA